MEKFLLEDCQSVWSHIQDEEEQLKMKRRWLMGLPSVSKSEQMWLKTPKFLKNVFLPESLLREDDVSYEIIRKTVERSFGTCSEERRHYIVQDYLHLCDRNKLLPNVTNLLPSVLDDMNNTGLLCLANIATGSSDKFEKTRWRMKKVIKECLPKILRNPNHKDYEQLLTNLPLILKDPRSFQETRVKLLNSSFVSHHAAAAKLLEELKDMPSQTLSAMRRKLKDAEGNAPQLQTPAKSGWTRHRLVKHVKRCCTNMLSQVNEGDELQKPLAKAMAIAVMSLKLRMESQNISLPKFFHFSPEIEALHNEIIKAIGFLKEMNIRNLEVEELRLLLDLNAEIPNAHFRAAIRRMLMEYLFECSEMAVIPNQLRQTLAIINRRSLNVATRRFSKEEIEEEVESVLCVSSQLKQIVLDFLPDCNTDKDFADVYMEDMQETDDDDDDDQQLETNCSQIFDSIFNDEVEGTGESMPVEYCISTSTTNRNGLSLPSISDINLNSSSFVGPEPQQITDSHPGKPHDCYSSSPCPEPSIPHVPQNTISNQYLAIQEICDETSLIGHRLIGRLLEEFLRVEGVDLEESKSSYLRGGYPSPEDCEVAKETQISEDSLGPVLVKVVKEVLPSFSKSGIQTVKKLVELS